MKEKTLFERICDRDIPADIIYEDELCLAFKDIDPQSPSHILLVPKSLITRLANATEKEASILGHMLSIIPQIAKQQGFLESGFRTVINSGPDSGETVPHLHMHILAGRKLTWPPG
ncbi:MAG: histidine triad nucleotide-binding protein [Verrucomicrobiota bacterium]